MKHLGVVAALVLTSAPAFAQESAPLPRFEALEQQTQALEQRQLDKLETQRQQVEDAIKSLEAAAKRLANRYPGALKDAA